MNSGDYSDDSDAWYYSDKDGKLVASEIKTINGKKYAFDASGKMKSGLRFIQFVDGSTTKIDSILADDNDNYPFDTEENFKKNAGTLLGQDYYSYYFGSGDDGSMKTNKQSVSIDGDSFNFLFNKSGSFKGSGKNGVDSSKYYLAGMLLAADKDDKYAVIKIDETSANTKYTLLTTDDFLDEAYVNTATNPSGKDYSEYFVVDNAAAKDAKITYKLINTSGTVQKGKSKAKDGNDRCYSQTGESINFVYVEK